MSVLLFSFATVMVAQDDVYFTPKKNKTVKAETPVQPVVAERDVVTTQTTTYNVLDDEWYKGRNDDMDMDAYNRRYVSAPDTVSVVRDTVYLYVDGEEASATDRLVRFHDYYDPWYYSSLAWDNFYGMPYDWYYNPWYYAGWGRHGWAWAYNYRWGWYDPWWGPGWGPRWHYSWHHGWNHGWNHGWHRNWVHYNSDGSRGYQNRGGRTVGGNHNYRGSGYRGTSYAGSTGRGYSGSHSSRGMDVANPGGSRVTYSGNRAYDTSRSASRINSGTTSSGSSSRRSVSSSSYSGGSSYRGSSSSYSGGSSSYSSGSSSSRGGGSFGGGSSSGSRGGGGISRGGRR